eukprot:11169345-Lingulodinium_polyedra.AAC.1
MTRASSMRSASAALGCCPLSIPPPTPSPLPAQTSRSRAAAPTRRPKEHVRGALPSPAPPAP